MHSRTRPYRCDEKQRVAPPRGGSRERSHKQLKKSCHAPTVLTPLPVSHRPATAYSRDTGPVTTMSSTTRVGWWRLLLAAIAAVLAVLLGATTASATTPPEPETRVGASTLATAYIVGPHQCITAGQRWGTPLHGRKRWWVAVLPQTPIHCSNLPTRTVPRGSVLRPSTVAIGCQVLRHQHGP